MYNENTVIQFQNEQQDVVTKIGAYLEPIKIFISKCSENENYAEDINVLRSLQPFVGSKELLNSVHGFLTNNAYLAYYQELAHPFFAISNLVALQTLPSKRIKTDLFISAIEKNSRMIAEVLVAIAQIPSPPIDMTIKARQPFQSFCFLINILSTVKDYVYIVDQYVDSSLFYRYLYRLPNNLTIKVVSDSTKWTRGLNQFVSTEELFKAEYPNYQRIERNNLHDRFLITETTALSLGGSIKDAAKKSDFTLVQLSESRRQELIKDYFE